ncbi:MAG: MBOAT family protein [Rubritalea sp.]|uniref:MBOAT family protein n=1 Tax=Rubritalea sp. TaxID=2109375 RepID=UPI00324239EF
MNVCAIALLLALTLIALAKLIFDRLVVGRMMVWLVPLAAYVVMHFASLELPPLLRMVLLCGVLMAGMKWIVYSEWRRTCGQALPWGRWLCFGLLWFGMEPKAWVGKRRSLQWKPDVLWGEACCLTGGILVFLMSNYEVTELLPLFIAMSVGFHFGILRLLTAFWRMQGFPVRALFRNPFLSRGFGDFWGKRWNLAYSQMMARAVKRPIQKKHGAKVATFSVFVISGLLHELAITVPVQAGYGLPTCFFIVQGILTTSEKRESLTNALFCGVSLIIGIHILFPAAFVEAVIIPARDVLNLLIL